MDTKQTTASASDLFDELCAFAAAGGMLTFVLGPFALPMLVLVAVAAIAAGLVALAATLVVGLVGAPVLLVVRLRRRQVPDAHARDACALPTQRPQLSQASSLSRLIGQ
jgi:Flp pilus assembly protein TadB